MGLLTDIKYVKLYFKVKPILDQLEGEMTMKFSTNMLTQILATAGQLFNAVGGVIPGKYQGLIAGILAGTQLIVASVSHYSNPDGTKVETPYVAPKV